MTKQEQNEKIVYGSLITSTKCYNCIHFPLCFAQKGGANLELASEKDCCYYQLKLPENSVVLSSNELKRLETNYKIGLGKSQSWCKSLKNRIEELEKENFKLKVDNEVLKEEKEQFENDVCNYEMNLQHLTRELENKSKETAAKILNDLNNLVKNNVDFGRGVFGWKMEEILMFLKIYADKQGVEIKE